MIMNKRNHPLYKTFDNMHQRCSNANNQVYKHYGARGIKVCDRWTGKDGFDNFVEDMGERGEGLSLDRINNNLGYFPENCRWATKSQQSSNTRLVDRAAGAQKDKNGKGWNARITIKNKTIYIGYYATKEEAHAAYLTARDKRNKAIGL